MADEISTQVENKKITLIHDSSIVYDPDLPNGHALAGFGALEIGASKTARLPTVENSPIHAQLVSVMPDGKVVAVYQGFATFRAGTGETVSPGDHLVGAGDGVERGYVKAADPADFPDPTTAIFVRSLVGSPRVDNVVDGNLETLIK